ncbi:PorP/SprF family type IX secretion system membrane protein [Echinicola shivajiensis]|uniref:PorP/SprF family type IX secretion system membrane protein n=1 Tax=Echinicola shivajiensis TaxID=1035916 RepID=UPI001BFC1A43|nr:type IX secretion system membrane protein PorP/SprF [Echinicola shivajiensis]
MKNRIYLYFVIFSSIIIILFMGQTVQAQQDAQFSQYMYNRLFYNPAFSGLQGGYQFSALHRSQWLGYTTSSGQGGAPTTQLLTATGRFSSKPFGWGLTFVNDDIGPTTSQDINISLAYHKNIRKGTLSLGVFGGVFSNTIKYDELDLVNPDPNVPASGDESQMSVNFGAGLLYKTADYYVSLSSRNINEPNFDFGDGTFDNKLRNHSYLMLGYEFKTFAQIRFSPSLLVKTVGLNNFSYDISVIATHNDRISGGLAYRGEESVSVLLGYQLLRDKSLRLGYAFDLVVGGNEAKSPSSHELMLSYNLPSVTRNLQKAIQRTPRFRF